MHTMHADMLAYPAYRFVVTHQSKALCEGFNAATSIEQVSAPPACAVLSLNPQRTTIYIYLYIYNIYI